MSTPTTTAPSNESAIDERIPKTYVPREVESRWYSQWIEQKVFEAKDDGDHTNAFCIVIPPPNVTGSLHCGHALFATIQDIYTRHARMSGKNALWLPGTDHAGIATQVVVERLLKKEGISRHDLGRAKFLERVWAWKEQSGNRIDEQLKVIGSSLDWTRERFTMDPHMSRAVREAFVRLHEDGLIYRAERLVNWSPGSQTVLSDLEVEQEEEDGELYSFAYALVDGSGEIVVSTTRPETMLGDTAVAVHPDDERYKSLVGKMLKHPFVDRQIPIVADVIAKPEFGTGAVKLTPAHDFNDFEAGKRQKLAMISILNKDGTLNDNGGEFRGLDRFVARKAVKRLAELGLERGVKKHRLAVPRDGRTGVIVEPMLSDQWYVATKSLAAPAIEAVTSGKTKIVPEEWTKTYMHWMTNIEDWCISRQLWWGHQIPAWYCGACKAILVLREDPNVCTKCGSKDLKQDEDVLDTWFSSGLWPFATLGWPEKTPALATFYPTTIMETGFDILFFWVARMMMFGLHFMGEIPFEKVYLHGMVTDEKGDKMSKVKGNVMDPLDVVYGIEADALVQKMAGDANDSIKKAVRNNYPQGIPAYGADALRWTLATYPPQQRKIPLSIKRVEGSRHLCNKLWNATRFALPLIDGVSAGSGLPPSPALPPSSTGEGSLCDRWILSRLAKTAIEVKRAIEEFRLDEATGALYRFFWNELCDWYLEWVKPVLAEKVGSWKTTQATLAHSLETTLRLMHPFIPFVTEELWQKVPHAAGSSIAIAAFPSEKDGRIDEAAEREMEIVQGAISAIRTIRSENEIHPGAIVKVRLGATEGLRELLTRELGAIRTLGKADVVIGDATRPSGHLGAMANGVAIFVDLNGLVQAAQLESRIDRELKRIEKDLGATEKKLATPNLKEKAAAVYDEALKRRDELIEAKNVQEESRAVVKELTPAG